MMLAWPPRQRRLPLRHLRALRFPQPNRPMTQNGPAMRGFLLRVIFIASAGWAIVGVHAQDIEKNPLSQQQGSELSSAPKSEAAEAWDAVKDTTNPALLEAFIKRYGTTFFAEIAKARLDELKATAAKTLLPKTSTPGTPVQTLQVPTNGAHERVV